MKKLRISYTLLNLWESNQIQEAVNYYQHKSTLFTDSIQDGRIYDQVWQEEIDTKKQVTIGKTTWKFRNPKTQFKIEVPYLDRFILVGVPDVIDLPLIGEFKTGTTSSLEYADGHQLKMYFFLCKLANIKVTTAHIYRYNQMKDEADITIFHNTPQQIEDAKNYIDTLGYEIWEDFEKRGIL